MCAPYFPGGVKYGEVDFSPPCVLPLPALYVHWGNRGNRGNMCIYTLVLSQNVCPIFPRKCELWRSGVLSSMYPRPTPPVCTGEIGEIGEICAYIHCCCGKMCARYLPRVVKYGEVDLCPPCSLLLLQWCLHTVVKAKCVFGKK